MVYKIKPLGLSFAFEDRDYALGDAIEVEVELVPNGEVNVRGPGSPDMRGALRASSRASVSSVRSLVWSADSG